MTVSISGTSGIVNDATDLNYTGTLTGGTGVVNLGSGQVYKDASGNVGIGTSSPARKLEVSDAGDGQIRITGTAAGNGGHMLVYSDSGNIASFGMNGSTGGRYAGTGANVAVLGTLSNNAFAFGTNNTERARIDSSGNLLVGTTNTDPTFNRVNGVVITPDGSIYSRAVGSWDKGIAATSGTQITFYTDNGARVGAGSITSNGSSSAYNTSSDYRLKEAIAPMTGALARVALLKPCTYKWKVDGSNGQGFIAHELAEVEAGCVTGEKDAVDAEGNPQYQGIDTSFLVATLAAAIQELKAIVDTQAISITALNERLTALEAPIV